MYEWRQLSAAARSDLLAARRVAQVPWHSPPRMALAPGERSFHLTAACFEHAPHIGHSARRMDEFCEALLKACQDASAAVFAWCVLPNHYHVLARCDDLRRATKTLGQLHGRSSRRWNFEQGTLGRQVFHRTSDRVIRSEAHSWASVNYIHHNPVKHGYVARWTDWPWSSAAEFLATVGREEAARIWKSYPLLDYGARWDV